MKHFEVQNPHYTARGGPWSDFGSHFCSSEMMRKKVTKQNEIMVLLERPGGMSRGDGG
jgi:hypothetical protein